MNLNIDVKKGETVVGKISTIDNEKLVRRNAIKSGIQKETKTRKKE